METLLAGGILMIPLGLCAVLSLAFILERVWVLSRIPDEQAAQQTLEEAERALAGRGQEAAAQYCADHKGPLCFIFASLLKRFDTLMLERREFRPTNERLARLAGQAGAGDLSRFLLEQKELSDLKDELVLETDEAGKVYLSRYLVVLNTIGNISPLLGLFGTILGMITSFQAIAVAGTGDPRWWPAAFRRPWSPRLRGWRSPFPPSWPTARWPGEPNTTAAVSKSMGWLSSTPC